MKRSEINEAVRECQALFKQYNFLSAFFADYTLADWRSALNDEVSYAQKYGLGWDVTDLNQEKFHELGLTLFTVRNGDIDYTPSYAEKVMHVRKNQVTPMHYHAHKAEDIINRNGGDLVIIFETGPQLENEWVEIYVDSRKERVQTGGAIALKPGQSVRILPYVFHSFWAEGQDVLAGEVSMTNDDVNDNYFKEPLGRFSDIVEDEAPYRLLCHEYKKWLGE